MTAKLMPFLRPEPRLPDYVRNGRTLDEWIADWKRWDALRHAALEAQQVMVPTKKGA